MNQESFSKAQRALAEPKRLEILAHIREMDKGSGITCSCVLAETDISQSTFSHHVSELFEAGLISGEKQGRTMLLTVNESVVESYLTELKQRILGK